GRTPAVGSRRSGLPGDPPEAAERQEPGVPDPEHSMGRNIASLWNGVRGWTGRGGGRPDRGNRPSRQPDDLTVASARDVVNQVDRPSNAAAVLEGDRRVGSTGDAIDGTIGAVVEEHNPVANLAVGEWLAPAGRDGTVTDDRLRRSIGGDRTN